MPSRTHILRAVLAVALLSALTGAAAAQTWQVPAGGELWTAGSSHTLAWTGGPAQVFGLGAYEVATNAFYPVGSMFTNTGYVVWNLPASLPPGNYYLTIGFTGGPVINSAQFTVRAAPECLFACNLVTAGMTTANPSNGTPPIAYCGTSAWQAASFAEAAMLAQLEAQCAAGYSVDQGSVQFDTTVLPFAVCYAGYSGGYMAESFAFGCCCPDVVPTETGSWGTIKSLYR